MLKTTSKHDATCKRYKSSVLGMTDNASRANHWKRKMLASTSGWLAIKF